MTDALLFDASSLFFVGWTLTITALGLTTFWHDVMPSRCSVDTAQNLRPAVPRRSADEASAPR